MTHGATGYAYHGCRCDTCRAANTARLREYRKRRTNKGPSTPGHNMGGHNKSAPASTGIDREHGNQEQES